MLDKSTRTSHRGARIWQHDNAREPGARRELAMYPAQSVKQACGYHRRSVAETAISRVKTIFSDRLCLRSLAGQSAQMLIRCAALNRMTPRVSQTATLRHVRTPSGGVPSRRSVQQGQQIR